MKFLLKFLLLTVLTAAFVKAEELQTGDLVFVSECSGEFSHAISESTAWNDSLRYIHVGVVEVDSVGESKIIEAYPEKGVTVTSLEDFIMHNLSPECNNLIVFKRLIVPFSVDESIKKAKSHLGEEYDWWFMSDNGKMYCSELIVDSYLFENGESVFHTIPMNFRTAEGDMPLFWIELFGRLGCEIPEGAPGSNPQALGNDNRLRIVGYKRL